MTLSITDWSVTRQIVFPWNVASPTEPTEIAGVYNLETNEALPGLHSQTPWVQVKPGQWSCTVTLFPAGKAYQPSDYLVLGGLIPLATVQLVEEPLSGQVLDLVSSLKNIEEEALGSWKWDKTCGNMEMFRQDGTTLATFKVIDTLDEASRERIL